MTTTGAAGQSGRPPGEESSGSRAEGLDDPPRRLLEAIIDAVVPGVDGAGGYLSGRLAAGRLDELDEVRAVLTSSGDVEAGLGTPGDADRGPATREWAAAVVATWSESPPGSRESRCFEVVRTWAWEAFLCDPSYGANRDQRGWRRFGYPGHPKSVDRDRRR